MKIKNAKILATEPDKSGNYKNLETRSKKEDGSFDILSV
jgi:hypothetical protein